MQKQFSSPVGQLQTLIIGVILFFMKIVFYDTKPFEKEYLEKKLKDSFEIKFFKNSIFCNTQIQEEIKDAEIILKKFNAKIADIIVYELPIEEIYTRNLIVIELLVKT